MLCQSAQRFGYQVKVLGKSKEEPAAAVTPHFIEADANNPEHLKKFLQGLDCATFESEFMDAELLAKVSNEVKVPIFPRPQHMAKIQDRRTQKELLDIYKIPTASWVIVDTFQDLERAEKDLGFPYVLKTRRFGYDGYGTQVVKNIKQQKKIQEGSWSDSGYIAEKFIPFKREVAIMIARNHNGELAHFPWVESFQKDSRCLWVKGPLKKTPGLSKLRKKLSRFIDDIGYVGVIGIEAFDTGKELCINELAPRVHNSGHYSQDALNESQFDFHIRSIFNLELKDPKILTPGFAMYNLLGSKNGNTMKRQVPAGMNLHWYSKKELRQGRKMGHINAVASSPGKALKLLEAFRKDFEI